MLPDVFAPTTCTTCGAVKSHDVRNVDTLALLGRVFQCGAAVSTAAAGAWSTAVICPRSEEIIFHLSADNVRLGDRGVLVAIAMLAAIEGLEKSLRAWATLPLDSLPKMALLELAPLRATYDELVDVLEGAAPTPAAERAAAIARDIIATRDAIEPPSKTEKRAIEQAMMTLAGQRERVDEDLGRLQHLIDGGRFDDSPTKWKAKKESKG